MKIALVTDAWHPQISGVVTTLTQTAHHIRLLGHEVRVISPDQFRTFPCPTERTLRLALMPGRKVARLLSEFGPDAVHIATEGPLGMAARRVCLRRGWRFTTSYCTRFPEYLNMRLRLPQAVGHRILKRFHAPSSRVMVSTDSLRRELESRGYGPFGLWPRGVDTDLFFPRDKGHLKADRPIFMYMGRVAAEKNIEDFLRLHLPGTKFVVGEGPALRRLRREWPHVVFTGAKRGIELARHLAAADVFVFPSKTDTFGLVMLEALACGVPVAAYPVQGPVDAIESDAVGVLDWDLGAAAMRALRIFPEACRAYACERSWDRVARQFLENLVPVREGVTRDSKSAPLD